MDAETLNLVRAFQTRGDPSYPEDRILQGFHPETMEFFRDGPGRGVHAIDNETLVRWGYCTKEALEYIFVRHINANKSISKIRVAVYEAKELASKLTDALYKMREAGVMQMGPTDQLPPLPILKGRNFMESADDARKNAYHDPDFETESKNVRVRVFGRGRGYHFCILNPAADTKVGCSQNYQKEWYGSNVIFSTMAVASFIELLLTLPEEIKSFRN